MSDAMNATQPYSADDQMAKTDGLVLVSKDWRDRVLAENAELKAKLNPQKNSVSYGITEGESWDFLDDQTDPQITEGWSKNGG